MNKAYSRINFQNSPSTATPLNATNLNKMDSAINEIDDRVIELVGYEEEAKAAAEEASAYANASAKAAETAVADAEARVNEIIAGLEVYTKVDSHKKFASVIKQTATGSPLLITDSAEGVAIDFDVYGRSTQAQYTGKNLLNASGLATTTTNGVTFTPVYDDNGCLLYVNVNGTATANTLFKLNDINVTENEKYTLNGCPSGGSSTTYRLYDNDNIGLTDYGNGVTVTSTKTGTIGVYIRINSGVTVNNLKFYPMIRLASVTDSTYEPYTNGASPNPTYPQAIESVGDMGYFDGELLQGYYSTSSSGVFVSNSNSVSSKNAIPCNSGDSVKLEYYGDNVENTRLLFYDESGTYISGSLVESAEITLVAPTNASYCHFTVYTSNTLTPQTAKHICVTINDKYALIVDSVGKNLVNNTATSQTINGVTFTVNEDKSVTVNTNGTTSAVTSILLGTYTFKANESYILSGQKTNTLLTFGKTSVGSGLVVFDSTVYTPTEDITLYARLLVDKGKTVNDTIYPMLRLASITNDTYEPYIHSRKYIPISAPLRGLGGVTDVASLSECEVERKFAEVVFDGSSDEGWSVSPYYTHVFSTTLLDFNSLPKRNVLSDKYVVDYSTPAEDVNSADYLMSIGRYINVKNKNFTTIDEWKAHLQANPITVIYELAEPITETIEPTEIVTYDNVTHISVSDNADMEVEYPTDTKKYIDNKFAELQAAIVNML